MQLVESSEEERAERKKDEESAERWEAGASAVTSERRFGSHGILKLKSSEHRESMILQAAAAAEADRSEADKKTPEEEGKNVAEGEKTVAEDKNGILPAPILTRTCPIKNPKIISNYQNWLGWRSHDFVSF